LKVSAARAEPQIIKAASATAATIQPLRLNLNFIFSPFL
jgi:hypothetical protein